jgi:hypothetical protein
MACAAQLEGAHRLKHFHLHQDIGAESPRKRLGPQHRTAQHSTLPGQIAGRGGDRRQRHRFFVNVHNHG